MNILFNIAYLDRNFGGAFQYASVLLNICGGLKNHTFFVYHLANDEHIKSIIQQHDNLVLVDDKEPILYKGIRIIQLIVNTFLSKLKSDRKIKQRTYFRPILKKYKIDIIHTPYQQLLKDEAFDCPSIATLHDVQELHFPHYFTPDERANRAINRAYITQRSDFLIVTFEHIKNDIIKYFKKDPDSIGVVMPNMKKLWLEKFKEQKLLDDVKNINLKKDKYLFYPAATWEHKNHLGLIRAVKYLKDHKNQDVKVICTGHQTDYYATLQAKVKELELEHKIHFLGIVSELELYSLYKNATLVVVPTMYEAGSLPVMESILLGVPVICSNVTSLPETIDNEAYTFDPANSTELGELIYKLLEDENELKRNLENSKRVSNRLINNNSMELIDNIYKKLSARHQKS